MRGREGEEGGIYGTAVRFLAAAARARSAQQVLPRCEASAKIRARARERDKYIARYLSAHAALVNNENVFQ